MFDAWSEWYSASAPLRSSILFLHVGGILLGGGCAIAADRLTLRAPVGDARQLADVRGVHRVVLAGLACVILSGAGMLAANLDTYLTSKVFWAKMAAVVLLLANGARLTQADRAAGAGDRAAWRTLRATSVISLFLWFTTVLLGAILPNV